MILNLLALETSGRSGSVAVSRADEPLSAFEHPEHGFQRVTTEALALDPRWGSAKTLVPAIENLLSQLGMQPSDLNAIAVVQGPGSFTGLRVGIATAKVMAYALSLPVVAIDTLDVIADQVSRSPDSVGREFELISAVDAFRGQCFWGRYRIADGLWHKTVPTRIDDNESLAQEISRGSSTGRLVVAGPSIQKLWDSYRELEALQVPAEDLSRGVDWVGCEPQATAVARLGWRAWAMGQTEDLFGLLPTYYRSSAAEEKQAAKVK